MLPGAVTISITQDDLLTWRNIGFVQHLCSNANSNRQFLFGANDWMFIAVDGHNCEGRGIACYGSWRHIGSLCQTIPSSWQEEKVSNESAEEIFESNFQWKFRIQGDFHLNNFLKFRRYFIIFFSLIHIK